MTRLGEEQLKTLFTNDPDAAFKYVQKLEKQVDEYRRRLGLNSSNSGKPPSTDSDKDKQINKNNNSRSSKSERKSGGQIGHKGTTLKPVKTPDKIIACQAKSCSCGHSFSGDENSETLTSRQVIDIPEMPKPSTIEYRLKSCTCPNCGEKNTGAFPDEVKAPIQYGKNLQAHIIYLMNYQLLPYKRTAELIKDFYGLSLSEGTLRNIMARFADKIEEPIEQIKKKLISSNLVHFDETGLYSEGKRHWLHVACHESLTFYFFHVSRGYEGIEAADVLPHFKGIACHDHWQAYYIFICSHSLCNAHHLRDLQAIIDSFEYSWAKEMKDFFASTNKLVKEAKARGLGCLSNEKKEKTLRKYQEIIASGYQETPKPPERQPGQRGRIAKGKTLNLLERFDEKSSEIIDFISDFNRPFDNNQAERDIRMMKVQQKISGTFRSSVMAQNFCKIRSYISTATKQGLDVFKVLADAVGGTFFTI